MPLFAASQQMDFYNTSLGIFKRHLKAVRRQIGLAGEKVQPKHFFFFITIKQEFQLCDAQVVMQRQRFGHRDCGGMKNILSETQRVFPGLETELVLTPETHVLTLGRVFLPT